jgi:hypothetical protein
MESKRRDGEGITWLEIDDNGRRQRSCKRKKNGIRRRFLRGTATAERLDLTLPSATVRVGELVELRRGGGRPEEEALPACELKEDVV